MPKTVDTGSAAEYVPSSPTLSALREAAAGCRACLLWRSLPAVARRGTRRCRAAGAGLPRRNGREALLGRQFRVTKERGRPVESDLAPNVVATVHPSSILRAEADDREAARAAFVDDLRVVAGLL